ncbi:MAG: hypothetical protein H5T86_16615, partial [Armatimonadetes bacterium]|nr:hypothetical protein [Armatimonadota bacterium]
MPLTGTNAVSEWLELTRWVITDPAAFPEQSNVIPQDDGTTVFKLPGGKSSAVFALRALQWRLDQHPVLEWAGASRGARWLIELTATDGVHPFAWKLWQSPWYGETKAGPGQSGFADSSRARYSKAGTDGETGASTASANAAAQAGRAGGEETASSQSSVDVRAVYRNAGWPNRYIEADVLVRLERTAEGPAELRLRLGARGRPAILPSQPVVVRAQEAENTGVPIEAVVVDSRGRLLNDASLSASIGGRPVPLAQQGSKPVYRAVVRGLHPGEYKCAFVALRGGEKIAEADASVSVTEMDFVDHYDRARRSYCTASGAALGPLLGDLFAWVPLAEIGTERRRLVCGPQQLEAARQEKVPVAY